jgi:hypothetical protein
VGGLAFNIHVRPKELYGCRPYMQPGRRRRFSFILGTYQGWTVSDQLPPHVKLCYGHAASSLVCLRSADKSSETDIFRWRACCFAWCVGAVMSWRRAPTPTNGRKKRQPASAPSSPRSRSPAPQGPLVKLSKIDGARLSVEADNFACRNTQRQAAAERRASQLHSRAQDVEQRVAAASASRQAIRSGMTRSQEATRQQNATLVTSQRERLESIAQRRETMRSEHAAEGRRLHEAQYGTQAAARRSALQADNQEQRKELEQQMVERKRSATLEMAQDAERRSASAGRVREHAGFHVIRSSLAESVRQRNADAQVKRQQSHEWAEAAKRERAALAPSTRLSLSTMNLAARERTKEELESLRRRVPDFADLRACVRAELDRKKQEAADVRCANECVENVAKDVRLHSARRRKGVHDWVVREKVTEVPQPRLAAGVGGIACSRKAEDAAAFAARVAPNHQTKRNPLTPSEHQTTGIKFRSHPFIFDSTPIGLSLEETSAGVVVRDVERGSAAAELGVPIGGLLLAVNALPLSGLTQLTVERTVAKANWPIILQIAPCLEFRFKDSGPIGLSVHDSQNGVIVRDVAEGSPAHDQGVPIGALLVAIQSEGMSFEEPAAGMSNKELSAMLRGRPLMLQLVPRDAVYLYRPKGVWRGPNTGPKGD